MPRKNTKKAHEDLGSLIPDQAAMELVNKRTGEVVDAGEIAVKIVAQVHPRIDTRIYNDEPSLTHQEFKDECDVNNILARWRKTGEMPHIAAGKPFYGDFTEATDYLESVTRIHEADEAFAALPSRVREVCANSPAKLLELLADEDRRDELVEAGLIIDQAEPPEGPNPPVPTSPEPPPQAPEAGPPQPPPPHSQQTP